MQTDGQALLQHFLSYSSNKFERRFARIAVRLELGPVLGARGLTLLYEATFLATLCNLTLNGLGFFSGDGRPERETIRTMLEREFMRARERFAQCPATRRLSATQMSSIDSILLRVSVADENLVA